MRTIPVLIAIALLAGCASPEESTGELAQNERARGISVSIPPEVERVEVEVRAASPEMVSLRTEVEREDRSNLAEARFTLNGNNATRTLGANVSGMHTLWVLVVADGGDATVELVVRGVTGANETMLLRSERLAITFDARPSPSPTGAANATDTTANGTNASP